MPSERAVSVDGLAHLHRQLAGRHEDQRGGPRTIVAQFREALEQRQREGRRLARAGRRLADQVAPFEERRDGFSLDGGRLLVSERPERLHQPRVEAQRREPHHNLLDRRTRHPNSCTRQWPGKSPRPSRRVTRPAALAGKTPAGHGPKEPNYASSPIPPGITTAGVTISAHRPP